MIGSHCSNRSGAACSILQRLIVLRSPRISTIGGETCSVARWLAVAAATAPHRDRQRLPSFSYDEEDDRDVKITLSRSGEIKNESIRAKYFPESFRPGAEMDVKIVRVHRDYALCRPLSHPHFKGKISNYEMNEHEREYDATEYVEENMIYKASIIQLSPPDRIVFSLRRVRRIVRDDFQPFTIVIFNLPPDLCEIALRKLMEEHGKVLEVTLHSSNKDQEQPSFLTFLHKEDALAAIRRWNRNRIPCLIGNETIYKRVRCKKSNHQAYRDRLQAYLDYQLEEQIQEWDETAEERRAKEMADQLLVELIPWYIIDRETEKRAYYSGYPTTYPEYTIKNNPRKE